MHLMTLYLNASSPGASVVPGIGLTIVLVNSYIISTEFGLDIAKHVIPGPFSFLFLLYFPDSFLLSFRLSPFSDRRSQYMCKYLSIHTYRAAILKFKYSNVGTILATSAYSIIYSYKMDGTIYNGKFIFWQGHFAFTMD
jgi:hypothetical protein